jgi:hypothetical protein
MGFASYGSNFFLELLALKYDLPVAWDRDFREVLCILGSLEVYFFINVDVRTSLHVPRLISRTLKLTIM